MTMLAPGKPAGVRSSILFLKGVVEGHWFHCYSAGTDGLAMAACIHAPTPKAWALLAGAGGCEP